MTTVLLSQQGRLAMSIAGLQPAQAFSEKLNQISE
jgi:hypothetical protein